MLRKSNKGYFLLDAVFSFSLFLTVIVCFLPVIHHIKLESTIINTRLMMISALYSEMQHLKMETFIPVEREMTINHHHAWIQIEDRNDVWYGCIRWNNVRGESEDACLLAPKNE
ncbi:hypothetical protein EDD68_101315 [Melghiribacillus thermohalophilus]|uniref:Competence protein ComGE n=1 Tax=Melghiribacillus thermohalophilus TaxID=1324956 RepID=A0A4R3NDE9_9BACI|nr:hypothetical protein [Melghiribacillus thermohalophilus]TCT26956.1 hypothetical protein EDD68_101315 [Melghiribacillus thermohalophilus]